MGVWASSCCHSSSSNVCAPPGGSAQGTDTPAPRGARGFLGFLNSSSRVVPQPSGFPPPPPPPLSKRQQAPNATGQTPRLQPPQTASVPRAKLLAHPWSFGGNWDSSGRTSAGGRRCQDDPGLRGATPTPLLHERRTFRPTLTILSCPRLRWGNVPATRLLLLPGLPGWFWEVSPRAEREKRLVRKGRRPAEGRRREAASCCEKNLPRKISA